MVQISWGQIGAGAMQQWLKDDDARINAAATKRAKEDERTWQKEKMEIQHGHRIKEIDHDNIKKASVEQGQEAYNYPFSEDSWEYAKRIGLPKFYMDKDHAKLSPKDEYSIRKLNHLDQSVGYLLNKPNLIDGNPKLLEDILQSALTEAKSTNQGGKRVVDGKNIEGTLKLESLININSLRQRYNLRGHPKAQNIYGQLLSYFNPEPRIYTNNNINAGKIFTVRHTHTNQLRIKPIAEYIPLKIFTSTMSTIQDVNDGNWMNNEILLINDTHNGKNFSKGAEALVNTITENKEFPEYLREGSDINNRPSTVEQVDFLLDTVMFATSYNYYPAERHGNYFYPRNTISKEAKAAALKQEEVSRDALAVIRSSSRIVQLNETMQELTKQTGQQTNISLLSLSGMRAFVTKVAPILRTFGMPIGTTKKLIDGNSFEDTFGNSKNFTEQGIYDEGIKRELQEALQGADKSLNKFKSKYSKENYENADPDVLNNIINAHIEYTHLKVMLTFKLAKLVQGGTGGRGVSDMDFKAVAKSLRTGSLSALPEELVAFKAVEKSSKEHYIAARIASFEDLQGGSNSRIRGTILNKTLSLHNALKRKYARRRRVQNQSLSDINADDFEGDTFDANYIPPAPSGTTRLPPS